MGDNVLVQAGILTVKEVPREDTGDIDGDEEIEGDTSLASQARRETLKDYLRVAPSTGVCHEGVGHSCCQRTRGGCHEIAVRVGDVTPFHRNDLRHDPEERLLESNGDTDEHLAHDERVDILRNSADDAADQANDRADNEEPGTVLVEGSQSLQSPSRSLTICGRKYQKAARPSRTRSHQVRCWRVRPKGCWETVQCLH